MGYLLAALLGGTLLFNSQATPERAAHTMENALRRQYPQSQIDVHVEGRRGFDVIKGKFKVVRLQMTGGQSDGGFAVMPIAAVDKAKKAGRIGQMALQLRDFEMNGLRIESADVTWSDVVYDFDSLRKTNKLDLVKTGPAKARVIVPAASLQTLMAQNIKDVQSPKLSLQNGRIIVTGTRAAPFFGTQLPFTLSAKPVVKNKTEIWLSDAQATFSGAPIPSALVDKLLEKANPVYTFSIGEKWPFAMNITRLNAANEKLEIIADMTFIPATATTSSTATATPKTTPASTPTPTPTPVPTATPSFQPA